MSPTVHRCRVQIGLCAVMWGVPTDLSRYTRQVLHRGVHSARRTVYSGGRPEVSTAVRAVVRAVLRPVRRGYFAVPMSHEVSPATGPMRFCANENLHVQRPTLRLAR